MKFNKIANITQSLKKDYLHGRSIESALLVDRKKELKKIKHYFNYVIK